jgi:magnesium transporter
MMRVAIGILPEVRQLLREDPGQLSELLEEIHEEDLADLVELLDDPDGARLLTSLKAEEAAPIFERLDEDTQEAMVEAIGLESVAPIVG